MGNAKYSDVDKATALAVLDANGGNVKKTATDTGIPRTTIERWTKGQAVNPDVTDLRHEKKGELADRLREIAHKLIDSVDTKIPDANLQQVFTALGITIEKMQLLSGEPTDRNEVVGDLSEDERTARIVAILDRARERRTQLVTGGTE